MAARKKITPPFAWLGKYRTGVGLTSLLGTASYFRFAQINSLPPGLDETSARIGLQALRLSWSNWYPPFDSTNSYSPLWVWLQSIAVHIFGHTPWALRLWPAIFGVLAVLVVWLLARSWFNTRIAWVAGLTMAVSPWAVTVSRNGLPSALPPLLVPLTLWLSGRARRRPTMLNCGLLGLSVALSLLSGPIGWLTVAIVIGVGAYRLGKEKDLFALNRTRAVGAGIATLGLALLGYIIAITLPQIGQLPHDLGLTGKFTTLWSNMVKVLLMFNVRGDENYRHNLSGEPLLNAFVGLMLIAGLLVGISRLHVRAYRILLLAALVLILPAMLTTIGIPNSSYAVGALPLIFVLVGVGTSYMLELWYATFPINSAARVSGQLAILLLLGLSFLQGYTQYFRAWAGSTAVYLAYNEGAVEAASRLRDDKFTGERYVVGNQDQLSVVEYLDYGTTTYRRLLPSEVQALPVAAASRQFYITASARDEAVKVIKAKFPGGVLRPHYSDFNQVEIYYSYEVIK